MRKWPWSRTKIQIEDAKVQIQKAEKILLESRIEVDKANQQEKEAFDLAGRLRELQRRNHFAARLTQGIHKGLRE